jgi:ABC-type glycerol-3-phosphate transport system substrate-binding protein
MMNANRITRRNFLRVAAVAAGATLAACTPAVAPTAQEGAAPASAATKVQFWWGWNPELLVNAINGVVSDFEAQNPDIQVETGQHEWGERLYTALAAGTPPDLFNIGPPAEFAARDAIIPLDDYMSQSDVASKDALPEVMVTQGTWRGKVYGVPGLENFALLAFGLNQRLMQEAGLSGTVEELPKTWEEGMEQIKTYSKIDDAGNIDLLWYNIEEADWAENGALLGVETYDVEDETFHFDDERWTAYFLWLQEYYDFLGVDKVDAFFSSYTGWSAVPGCSLCVGKQAGFQDGYWQPGSLIQTSPDETFLYSWPTVPANRAGVKVQMVGIHHDMIAKDSPNPDAAWRLAEYITTDEANKKMFDSIGWLIPTKALIENPDSMIDVDKYPGLRFYVESMNQADELWAYPGCPIDSFVIDQFGKARDAVVYHEKSIEQAMADLQTNVTEELQKALGAA